MIVPFLGNGERTRTASTSRRGRKSDPLYRARRILHTGADLLSDKRAARLTALFAIDEHVEVEATWGIYQRMIAAYRHPDPAAGRELMVKLIESLSAGVPRPLVEIAKLGRTLSKRAADVLAYFDARHQQRSNRSDQRPPGVPARLRPRLPQPHQLHRPIPTRDRRIQTPTTPCLGEEPLFLGSTNDGNRQPVILGGTCRG
jgi:Transposase